MSRCDWINQRVSFYEFVTFTIHRLWVVIIYTVACYRFIHIQFKRPIRHEVSQKFPFETLVSCFFNFLS